MLVNWVKNIFTERLQMTWGHRWHLIQEMVFEVHRFYLLQISNIHSLLSMFTTIAHVQATTILHLCLHAHPLPIHSPNCGQGYISKMKILSCYCSPEIPRMVATWLIMVVVANLYAFSKSHRTAQLKRVNFTVCKLHLNKSDFKNLCHRHCSPGKNRTFHRVMVLHSRLDIPSQPGAAWIQSPAL